MNTDKITYLSQEKFDELRKELTFLTDTKRGEIAKLLEDAKSFGDLSENAEYHQAREAQANVEARIRELEDLLESVEIVSHRKSDIADVGTTVTLQAQTDKEERTFEIVGSEEADMQSGKISLHSPLGSAMIGKKINETFVFKTPVGKEVTYKVLKIE